MAFPAALERMRALHAAVHAGTAAGRVLLVEHEPVYTAGRATPAGDLRPGIVAIDRGGRITYHGPGQLVVYPIVRLPERDLRAWLRRLEAFGVGVAATFGLAATPSVDGTGVFVAGRKFASIGVHVKHWINLHGMAINVAMDMAPWLMIQPCGLPPETMTDLTTACGRPVTMAEATSAVIAAIDMLTSPRAVRQEPGP